MATVVATWRSAPRETGATMLVGPAELAVGSLSGGCVESAVFELALEAATTGTPGLHHFGVNDAGALTVSVTCGGEPAVYVERVDPRGSLPPPDRVR